MQVVTAPALADWLADAGRPTPVLLDVREPWEAALCALPGSRLIPLQQLPGRVTEIDPEQPVVVICHHGVRSYHGALVLQAAGFTQVFNLEGGIDAWACAVDPGMPRY